jgi:deoxyribodipyrimidine photo-lyase
VRQAKRFDRDGAYVRRYVAELRDIEHAYVHEPWRAPRAARPADYPAPVVDVPTMGRARD